MVLVGTIELHQELGGDLVASLAAVAEGLADRERLRLEAEVATAQARLAARIVPLAPVVSLGFLGALAPSALAALFTTAPGLAILGVSAGLTCVALFLLRRIARAVGL
jgi:Flp pilus assembly protein TadB